MVEPAPELVLSAFTGIDVEPRAVPTGGVTVNDDVADPLAFTVTVAGEKTPDHPLGTNDASENELEPHIMPVSRLVTVTVYATPCPATPDPDEGDTDTVGDVRVHPIIGIWPTYEAVAVALPDPVAVAIAFTVCVATGTIAGEVMKSHAVPEAPGASDSDVGTSVLVHPVGVEGDVDVSANVLLPQPLASLLVTLNVYARTRPPEPFCEAGVRLTVGAARTQVTMV